MAIGYYIAEIFLYGARASTSCIPGILLQGIVGIVIVTFITQKVAFLIGSKSNK